MSVTYVGLLRGINVGRNKRIAMADLRAMLESLGNERRPHARPERKPGLLVRAAESRAT